MPRWDAKRRELWVGHYLVKDFRRPAPHQELIVVSFEEQGWVWRIDDPLTGGGDVDRERRLRDTVHHLNQGHRHHIIRFFVDGKTRIRWGFTDTISARQRRASARKCAQPRLQDEPAKF